MGGAMVSSSQIKAQLALFLDHQISLEAFEDWFARNTWNMHQSGSVAAEQITFAIEESLSEYSSRHLDEANLRAEFSEILGAENRKVTINDQPQLVYIFRAAPSVKFVRIPLTV
jgi:hypothetical protein